jgi:hypothetical protein
MRSLLTLVLALLLSGCALGSLSSNSSSFNTVERVTLSKQPDNFIDGMITIGKSLGYQYSGSDRDQNSINFTDTPNLGQSVLGTYFQINIFVGLASDGRTVEMRFIGSGSGGSAGEEKSTARLEQLKAAIRNRWP